MIFRLLKKKAALLINNAALHSTQNNVEPLNGHRQNSHHPCGLSLFADLRP